MHPTPVKQPNLTTDSGPHPLKGRPLRKVVLYSLTSIDGVAEAPDQFVLDFDDRMRDNLARVVGAQDAVILGRHSYDDWAGYWPSSTEAPFAPFINSVDKYVVTSTEPVISWERTTVVHGSIRDLVGELRSRPGGDIGVHGSITLAQSMFADGLIDELRLVVAPNVAGSGRHLFDRAGRRRLRLLESERTPSGALLNSYRVKPTGPPATPGPRTSRTENPMHDDSAAAAAAGPPGYAVAYLRDVELDAPAIAEYLARIDATLTPHRGEFLVHGATPEALEGEWPGSIVIIRFPSMEQARSWYESPGYQDILPLRTEHSHSIATLLEGVPAGYRAADLLPPQRLQHREEMS